IMRLLLALVLAFALICGAAAGSMKRDVGTAECDICTWVVSEAEQMLESNKTEQEIITDLDKVRAMIARSEALLIWSLKKILHLQACGIFGPFAAECQSLVATYVPQVIALLEQKVPPSQVCQQIGLCTSARPMAVPKKNVIHHARLPARRRE